jgi:hypothetical protein
MNPTSQSGTPTSSSASTRDQLLVTRHSGIAAFQNSKLSEAPTPPALAVQFNKMNENK